MSERKDNERRASLGRFRDALEADGRPEKSLDEQRKEQWKSLMLMADSLMSATQCIADRAERAERLSLAAIGVSVALAILWTVERAFQ